MKLQKRNHQSTNEIRRLTAVGVFLEFVIVLPKPRIAWRGILRTDARPDDVLLTLGWRTAGALLSSAPVLQRPAAQLCGATARASVSARPMTSPTVLGRACALGHHRLVDEGDILSHSLHLALGLRHAGQKSKKRRKKKAQSDSSC